MTSISDLPIELLDVIFHRVAALIDNEKRRSGIWEPWDVSAVPAVPDRTLFPLNVAAVCTLWLQVLKSHSRYWYQVVIDVASDPAPFLDMLGLFMDDSKPRMNLIVFSSEPSIDKDVEKHRVDRVFDHLEPVIQYYTTITFRLVYQSSLPWASEILLLESARDLTELFLTCTTYDCSEDDADDNEIKQYSPYLELTISTNLRRLSLTGFDFFNLCLCGWLETRQTHLQLSITHYKFRKHWIDGTTSCKYFAVLMQFLHDLNSPYKYLSISLSDISLAYRPSRKITSKYTVSVANMTFTNVSADFTSAFFSAITLTNALLGFVSFRNCVIPCIAPWLQDLSVTDYCTLELADIPCNDTTAPSNPLLRREQDDSLYNAIEAFSVHQLRFIRCDGVTDRLLNWISGDDYAEIEVPRLKIIKLHDCTNFTAKGLCALLVNRHRRMRDVEDDLNIRTLGTVEVFGEGPAIYEDELPILERKNLHQSVGHGARVSWNVVRRNYHEPGCVTDLRPLEEETSIWDRLTWGLHPVQL